MKAEFRVCICKPWDKNVARSLLGFRSVNNPAKSMDLIGKFTIFGMRGHKEENRFVRRGGDGGDLL